MRAPLLVVLLAVSAGSARADRWAWDDETSELEVRNFFSDPSQQFFAGRWSATRGKWRVRYSEHELCVMTAGRVVLESASGERASFGPGDAFVVPAGFVGTWEVVEDCSKIYAIFEARS